MKAFRPNRWMRVALPACLVLVARPGRCADAAWQEQEGRAQKLLEEGKSAPAAALFSSALAGVAKSGQPQGTAAVRLWSDLAGAYSVAEDTASLAGVVQALEGMRPKRADTWRALAHALRLQERWADSSVAFSQAAKAGARDTCVERAFVERRLGRPRRAIPLYRQALRDGPDSPGPVYEDLAEAYLEDGRPRQARDAFALAKRFGGDVIPYGYFELNQGNDDEAEREFKSTEAARVNGQAASLQHLGSFYDNLGRFKDAEAALRQALRLQRSDPSSYPAETQHTLAWLGNVLAEEGRLAEAEAAFREGVDIAPSDIWGRSLHGLLMSSLAAVLEREGKAAEAGPLLERAQAYCRARCLDLYRCGVLEEAAGIYADDGDAARATAAADEAVSLCRPLPEVQVWVGKNNYSFHDLAGVYAKLGRRRQAESLYRETLTRLRKLPFHYNVGRAEAGLAALYLEEGRLQEAERLYRLALAVWRRHGHAPEETEALEGLAAVYAREGRGKDAAKSRAMAERLRR